MTSADYTCYPFATMNSTDYFNLLGVYLDAAFFPKLSREAGRCTS
jgi:Zn-dependent M16 (insulinase) family peptidase